MWAINCSHFTLLTYFKNSFLNFKRFTSAGLTTLPHFLKHFLIFFKNIFPCLFQVYQRSSLSYKPSAEKSPEPEHIKIGLSYVVEIFDEYNKRMGSKCFLCFKNEIEKNNLLDETNFNRHLTSQTHRINVLVSSSFLWKRT